MVKNEVYKFEENKEELIKIIEIIFDIIKIIAHLRKCL